MSHHYLRFSNVDYTYPNGHKALNNINLHISHGEKVALIGANGSGKSTLTLLCNGLLLPTHGNVSVGGIPIGRQTVQTVRQNVGLVFQNPDHQLFMPTVEEDVAFGPRNMNLPDEEVSRRVDEALNDVNAQSLKHRSPLRLSGGEKKRVAIATVLSMEPNMLIMDEPTSSLDPKSRRQIINLIKSFAHSCLIATHDLAMVDELCSRCIVLKNGTIIADDRTENIFGNIVLLEDAGLRG